MDKFFLCKELLIFHHEKKLSLIHFFITPCQTDYYNIIICPRECEWHE